MDVPADMRRKQGALPDSPFMQETCQKRESAQAVFRVEKDCFIRDFGI